jgi:hypothetical protein
LWACVVVVASVGDVASARFASHADCAKGNASGGCALLVNATKFCGQGICGYPSGIYENELTVGATWVGGQPRFIRHPSMYGSGYDPPIGQHPRQFVGIVAFWAIAVGFVGMVHNQISL